MLADTFDTAHAFIPLTDDLYWWRVRAFDLAGNEGLYSSVDSFGVDATAPLFDSTTVWPDTSHQGPFQVYSRVRDLAGIDSVVIIEGMMSGQAP